MVKTIRLRLNKFEEWASRNKLDWLKVFVFSFVVVGVRSVAVSVVAAAAVFSTTVVCVVVVDDDDDDYALDNDA